jgi:hypothetical protein
MKPSVDARAVTNFDTSFSDTVGPLDTNVVLRKVFAVVEARSIKKPIVNTRSEGFVGVYDHVFRHGDKVLCQCM